jgi:hypothetical protein
MSFWENHLEVERELKLKTYWKEIEKFYSPEMQKVRDFSQHKSEKIKSLEFGKEIKEIETKLQSQVTN